MFFRFFREKLAIGDIKVVENMDTDTNKGNEMTMEEMELIDIYWRIMAEYRKEYFLGEADVVDQMDEKLDEIYDRLQSLAV